mgnify:CR=1 FL=1
MKRNYKNKKAFTLIELLIVIAIIGILFVVLVSKVDFATDKAKATGVQTDFRSFQVAFDHVAKENAGFASLGWDTGDENGNRKRDSYDVGDINENGIMDVNGVNGFTGVTEVWTGHKEYDETWFGIYTLVNPDDDTDTSAFEALEAAINANLDPKLHITITPELSGTALTGNAVVTMANGAQDPWKKEYHGVYITNAVADNGADRGAFVIYSDGANGKWGSAHDIANGIVNVWVPNNNIAGKDDYAISVFYSYANGYGEVAIVTTGFSSNQKFLGETPAGELDVDDQTVIKWNTLEVVNNISLDFGEPIVKVSDLYLSAEESPMAIFSIQELSAQAEMYINDGDATAMLYVLADNVYITVASIPSPGRYFDMEFPEAGTYVSNIGLSGENYDCSLKPAGPIEPTLPIAWNTFNTRNNFSCEFEGIEITHVSDVTPSLTEMQYALLNINGKTITSDFCEAFEPGIVVASFECNYIINILINTSSQRAASGMPKGLYYSIANWDNTPVDANLDINIMIESYDYRQEYPMGGVEITDSWEDIQRYIDDGSYLTRYKLGDYKVLELTNGSTEKMEIVAFNTDATTNNKAAAITWISSTPVTTGSMQSEEGAQLTWETSEIRTYLQTDIYNLIPTNVSNLIVPVQKSYYDGYSNTTKSCIDTLWVPSFREMVGGTYVESYGCDYRNYFRTYRDRWFNGSLCWLRSMVPHRPGYWNYLQNEGYYGSTALPTRSYCVIVGFCMGQTNQSPHVGTTSQESQQLLTPNVTLNNNTLHISSVPGASGYHIIVDDELLMTTNSTQVDLSSYLSQIENKWLLIRAIGTGNYYSSDFAYVWIGTGNQTPIYMPDGSLYDDWNTIKINIDNGSYKTRYKLGDFKHVTLSDGRTITVEIVAIDSDIQADGSIAALTWMSKTAVTHMSQGYYASWNTSPIRTWLHNDSPMN